MDDSHAENNDEPERRMPHRYTAMPRGSKSRSDDRERVAGTAPLLILPRPYLSRNSGIVHINQDEHESKQFSVAGSKVWLFSMRWLWVNILEELNHIVRLYGRFLRNTYNSKPVVNTVSQLGVVTNQISARSRM